MDVQNTQAIQEELAELVRACEIKLFMPQADGGAASEEASGVAGRKRPEAAGSEPSNTDPANLKKDVVSGGIDWLSCSVYGDQNAEWGLWQATLASAKTHAQETGRAAIQIHPFGDMAEVMAFGSGSGLGRCQYVVMYCGIRIEISHRPFDPEETRKVSQARVTIPGRVLLQHDLDGAIQLAEFALGCLGIEANPAKWEPSRVDVCADLAGVSLSTFAQQAGPYGQGVISRAADTYIYCKHRKPQTIYCGASQLKMRVYDKLAECEGDDEKMQMMIANRWGHRPDHAVRVEYEMKRRALVERGVINVMDLLEKLPALCNYLTEDWCRITGPNTDRNNSQNNRGTQLWERVKETFREWAGKAASLRRVADPVPDAKRLTQQAIGCITSLCAVAGVTSLAGFKNTVRNLADLAWDIGEVEAALNKKAGEIAARGRATTIIHGLE